MTVVPYHQFEVASVVVIGLIACTKFFLWRLFKFWGFFVLFVSFLYLFCLRMVDFWNTWISTHSRPLTLVNSILVLIAALWLARDGLQFVGRRRKLRKNCKDVNDREDAVQVRKDSQDRRQTELDVREVRDDATEASCQQKLL